MIKIPTISKQAAELAKLMYLNKSTIEVQGWPGECVTFFYLDTKHHLLYSGERGFGMKVSIKHPKGKRLGLDELELEIQLRMNYENSLYKTNVG